MPVFYLDKVQAQAEGEHKKLLVWQDYWKTREAEYKELHTRPQQIVGYDKLTAAEKTVFINDMKDLEAKAKDVQTQIALITP